MLYYDRREEMIHYEQLGLPFRSPSRRTTFVTKRMLCAYIGAKLQGSAEKNIGVQQVNKHIICSFEKKHVSDCCI